MSEAATGIGAPALVDWPEEAGARARVPDPVGGDGCGEREQARNGERAGDARRAKRACAEAGMWGAPHSAEGNRPQWAASPKCSSTSDATSRIAQCPGSRRGDSTPHKTSAPSESLACSEPWLPPPTCACLPQSVNS